jgi:hypothetical protein
MNNKFEQAIAESLQAVEAHHEAMENIDNMVKNLDEAVSGQTDGQLGVRANRVMNQDGDEDLPLGRISILVYVYKAPERQREVCELRPALAGYPIEVLSFVNTRTSCPDLESLEYKVAEIIRDARFGSRLKALMSEAGTQMAEPPAVHEGASGQPDAE